MEQLFYNVLKMSLAGSWVILAVLLFRLCLRKAPRKYSYALWAAAAFRLLCPVTFRSALSLFSLRLGPEAAPVVNLPAVTEAEYQFVRPQLSTGVPYVNMAVGESFGFSRQPDLTASANPEQIWLFIATVLWCAGVAAMLLYSAVSYLRLRLRVREAVLLEKGVWQTERVGSPFLLGLFRPRIYVPFGLGEQELCHVLAHERMHIRRLDHVAKPLAFLILTVHWFNPFVWLAFMLMCRDMELSCDQAVLRRCGDIRREYSQTLLNVAASRRFPSPSPLAFGEGDVKCRIRGVLKWKKPGIWVTVLALVLCAAVILVCVADPREEPENEYFPFADVYVAEEVVYQCPILSMLYLPENLPEVALSSDQGMFLREPAGSAEQTYDGVFLPAELKKEEFEALFLIPLQETGVQLRKSNKNIWHLDGEEQWYLLEQKNGDLYLVRCLAFGDSHVARWIARMTPRKQIWASVNGGSHYELSYYRKDISVDYALLPAVSAKASVTLEFHLNRDVDFLTVEEEYYGYENGEPEEHRSSTTVKKDSEGNFRLTVNCRGKSAGDYAVYSVQDGEFCHLLRVDFSPTHTPAYDHVIPDPEQTDFLQQAWNEARLRTVLAANAEFAGAELLDLVVTADSAEGLAGVAQYRKNGNDGCFAFVEESGIVHPVIVYDVLDVADSPMEYLPGDAVQLRLRNAENGNELLYTVRFSKTEEGVHIRAESEAASPLDKAVTDALKSVLHSGDQPTGLLQARSYSAVNVQSLADGGKRVCAWVMHREYAVAGGEIRPVNTLLAPAVLVFDENWELGDFQLLADSQTPGDVKNFFGAAAATMEEGALQKENYRQSLEQSCLQSAMRYMDKAFAA